jgi:hypothetical protein
LNPPKANFLKSFSEKSNSEEMKKVHIYFSEANSQNKIKNHILIIENFEKLSG